MQKPPAVKAVLFDMGGVVVEYADPAGYLTIINKIKSMPNLHKHFVDFECGRITLADIDAEFFQLFGFKNLAEYETKILKKLTNTNPHVFRAIQSLCAAGKYSIAVLTNNGFLDADRSRSTLISPPALSFEHIIESCKIGARKPELAFYEKALSIMGLRAEECVFIDDLEENCAGARAVGIKSIWLKAGNAKAAMLELEAILEEKLLLEDDEDVN